MLRILHIGMSPNPGGVENFVMNIYRNIDRSKIQFDFLLDHNASKIAYEDEIISLGGKIYRSYYRRKEFFKKGRKSIKTFFKQHPEITGVHMHANTIHPMFKVLEVAKKMGIKVRILHSHNSNYMTKLKLKDKLYEKCARKKLDYITTNLLACSEEAGKWMFHTNNFQVIKNGIDVDRFNFNQKIRNKTRQELGLSENFVIGHVGRMNYQKNPIYLLEVFKCIHQKDNNSRLLYVGDGDEKDKVKKYIKDNSLEGKVILAGAVKDTYKYFCAMDVFFLPSRFEGLGIVLLEAQANGLKCYTTDMVPKETNIIGNVEYIGLSVEKEKWAEEILKGKNEKRKEDVIKFFEQAEYDIKSTVKEIQKIYSMGKF